MKPKVNRHHTRKYKKYTGTKRGQECSIPCSGGDKGNAKGGGRTGQKKKRDWRMYEGWGPIKKIKKRKKQNPLLGRDEGKR